MIGSLSAFSPSSFQSYGASVATPQSLANDGSAVCASLDCGVHGALNRAQLQAQFPGLTILGGAPAQQPGKDGTQTRRPVGGASSSQGLSSGETLLGAQQQRQQPDAGRATVGTVGGGDGHAHAAGETHSGEAEAAQAQSGGTGGGADDLSEEERAQVAKLKQVDAKVRAHERAHAAVGGQYAGAPSYSYTRGPDGQMYAIGGEVSIDIGAEDDPQATLQKASQVAAAALAPADPSGQDRAVAAAAAQLRLQALGQIREEKRAEDEQKEVERTAQKEADEARAEAAKQEDAEAAPVLPGQTPATGEAAGETQGPQTGSSQSGAPQQGGDQTGGLSGADGPASRAAQAYAQVSGAGANDNIAAGGRRLGQLVGLIA